MSKPFAVPKLLPRSRVSTTPVGENSTNSLADITSDQVHLQLSSPNTATQQQQQQHFIAFVTVQDRNPCLLEPKHKLKLDWNINDGEPAITVQDMLNKAFTKQSLRNRLELKDPAQSIGQFFDPMVTKDDGNADEDGHFLEMDYHVINGSKYSVVLVHKKQKNNRKRKHPEPGHNMESSSEVSSWTHDRTLRERSQSLRRMCAEAEMEQEDDEDEEVEQYREEVALDLRKINVRRSVEQTRAARRLDLCFLVDVTGSMQPYIDSVKTTIRAIVDRLTRKDGNMKSIVEKIRLAFVGYRDFCDPKQFEVLQFTNSVEEFQKFCDAIVAEGGGDAPEDVFGGLEKMFTLDWSTDGSTRMLFHIADAPCHGTEFHNLQKKSDFFPNGDPKGRSINTLLGKLADKRIQYYFGRINGTTNKMIVKFSEAYDRKIVVCDLANPDRIFENVVSTSSIAVTINANQMGSNGLRQHQKYKFEQSLPDWAEYELPIRGVLCTYQLPDSFKTIVEGSPLKADQPVKATIQIAKKPFAAGAERLAFYGRDVTKPLAPKQMVLKKYINNDDTGNGSLNNSADSAARHESAIEMQTIAAFLALQFNEKIRTDCAIRFSNVQMFKYTDSTAGAEMFMSCEKRYPTDTYLRFTNNLDYAMLEETANLARVDMQFLEQLLAFSHWTYQITRGYLMVVDLQGIISKDPTGKQVIELTDPAIHCTDMARFTQTNMGEDGMQMFFSRHKCNEFCKQLGLKIPTKFANQTEDDE